VVLGKLGPTDSQQAAVLYSSSAPRPLPGAVEGGLHMHDQLHHAWLPAQGPMCTQAVGVLALMACML